MLYAEPRDGDFRRTRYHTPEAHAALPEAERERAKPLRVTERLHYLTKYGPPLAYLRPLEILAQHGLRDIRGRRVADFGYGGIGHLQMLSMAGADLATGVDVDPLLPALYPQPPRGVRIVNGAFPTEPEAVRQVGTGYDVFLSKNTLKRGYIHPERPADPRNLIQLGVPDEAYLAAVHQTLKPGGLFLIYNLHGPQNPPDKPFLPMADGRSPFSRRQFEDAGFEVLAFDQDDGPKARAMALILGFDQGRGLEELNSTLFATYTLARRKR